MEQISSHCTRGTVVTILGNKCDLSDSRVIDTIYGESLARKHNFSFFETSSYTNNNVSNAIVTLVKRVLYQTSKGYSLSNSSTTDSESVNNTSKISKKKSGD